MDSTSEGYLVEPLAQKQGKPQNWSLKVRQVWYIGKESQAEYTNIARTNYEKCCILKPQHIHLLLRNY